MNNLRLRYLLGLFGAGIALIIMLFNVDTPVSSQISATATPRRVSLPTATPIPTTGSTPTATQTPTEEMGVMDGVFLQALETAGEINVRAQGDINADVLGSIQFGDTYLVTGRYFRWFRIAFDSSPTGQAFVFEDLVEIVNGDVSTIPDLSLEDIPSAIEAPNTGEIEATVEAVDEQTEVDSRDITPQGNEGIVIPQGDSGDVMQGILPTFTYPASFAEPNDDNQEMSLDEDEEVGNNEQNSFAPITPILVLGALGAIGLLLSSIRR